MATLRPAAYSVRTPRVSLVCRRRCSNRRHALGPCRHALTPVAGRAACNGVHSLKGVVSHRTSRGPLVHGVYVQLLNRYRLLLSVAEV